MGFAPVKGHLGFVGHFGFHNDWGILPTSSGWQSGMLVILQYKQVPFGTRKLFSHKFEIFCLVFI